MRITAITLAGLIMAMSGPALADHGSSHGAERSAENRAARDARVAENMAKRDANHARRDAKLAENMARRDANRAAAGSNAGGQNGPNGGPN